MAALLIIDDDLDTVEVLKDVLRDEGHDVRVARNGMEGLALVQAQMPELILLDVEMRVLDGPEWLTRCSLPMSDERESPSFSFPTSLTSLQS